LNVSAANSCKFALFRAVGGRYNGQKHVGKAFVESAMQVVHWARAAGAALGSVGVYTAVLWYLRPFANGLAHPVFLYLPLIALVAIVYGSLPAVLCAAAATACAVFFFYEPIFSFRVSGGLEVGDFLWFAVLVAIGVKCTVKLSQPLAKVRTAKSR
jgi:K+-sensing histidine kinase KdpD